MKKIKNMSLVISTLILVLIIPHNMICLAAEVEEAILTKGKYDFDSDSTTIDIVYEIENGQQLLWFSRLVGGELTGVGQNKSANAILVSDIDLSSVCGAKTGSWEPIGTDYSGIFDGNGKTVRNLYFDIDNKYFGDESKLRVGIFSTTVSAVIKNITLEDSYINASRLVGGIVGEAVDSKILNCCNKAEITAKLNCVGGITGYGAASECYNMGKVTGDYNIGGIAGYATGDIINCFNTGEISATNKAGGIIGYSRDPIRIENCYSASKVCASSNSGSIAGYLDGSSTGTASVANCYFDSDIFKGIGAGYTYEGTLSNIKGCTTEEFKSGEICWLLNGGSSDGAWKQTLEADTYPGFSGKTVYCDNSQYYNEMRLNLTKEVLTVKDLSGSASLIAASYKDKAFVDAKVIPVSGNYENTLADIGLKISGADTVKAFLWEDMMNLMALCKPQEIMLE